MKKITEIFEGLFDNDFDALNIPTEPIDINIPICRGGDRAYTNRVRDYNAVIAVISRLGDINRAFQTFTDINDDIKKSKGRLNAVYCCTGIDASILNSWSPLDITKTPLKETLNVISIIQKYNDVIGVINKMSWSKLLKEAEFWYGLDPDEFDGTYIRWHFTKNFEEIYNELEPVVSKLKLPGFKVDLGIFPKCAELRITLL